MRRAAEKVVPTNLTPLAGVPASGKTYFGEWLAMNHGYIHIDVEKRGQLAAHGFEQAWNQATREMKPEILVRHAEKLSRQIVINWGSARLVALRRRFPRIRLRMLVVHRFHRRRAHRLCPARGDQPRGIRAPDSSNRSPLAGGRAVFEPNIVETLRHDGVRLEPETVLRQLRAAA